MKNEELKSKIAERKEVLQEYGKRFVNDSCKVEMLVQETLDYAIEKCEKDNGGEKLDGWLLSILHNVFLRGEIRIQSTD